MRGVWVFIIFLVLSVSARTSLAMDLALSIQPILPKAEVIKAYTPLAEYLSSETGQNITVKGYLNFITYWADMRRKKGFDLVLDAAHFTDYRVQKFNFKVLAKLPASVSFSLVTHEDNLILDQDELVLKKVATLVSPSVGALRLSAIFDNPMRQPRFVYARDANDAARRVIDKKVDAAIIPTALVGSYDGLNTVLTTEPLPHMAFSTSPDVPDDIRASIKKALINAKNTAKGQAMLAKLNFESFEDASAETYKGYSKLLQNVLGY